MKITRWFEEGAACNAVYIIAEVSQNHDGSLGQAHAFIDAVAGTGVDAIKFQTHIAEAESTPDEPFRVKFSYEDKTRYDYWKRMEFTFEQWEGLYRHAREAGLDFLSSVFSVEAFEMMQSIGMPAWKLGSGEVFNNCLVDKMVKTGKPILLSTGLSSYEDIDRQVEMIKTNPYAVMQCTTAYPCPPEKIGLNLVSEMRDRYKCPIGLSDHSGTIFPSLAAVANGALMIEVHVTMSPYMFGPDVKASVTIEQLREMTEGIRMITAMRNAPVDKTALNEEQKELKHIFAKGIYLKRDVAKGEKLELQALSFKKPLTAISGEHYEEVLGKRLLKDLKMGEALRWSDLEGGRIERGYTV
ncbi:MAG: N-acetylneuraminate synthase family protein [Lachnospiraceae bacterium]|nr:N-acetylneuraminate synthase family protein [Lachnospiraceae bacterium]